MPTSGMLKRWLWQTGTPQQLADCKALSAELGLPPLLAKLLAYRRQTSAKLANSFLNPRLSDLHDPLLLPGVDQAAQRIEQAAKSGQPIVIYGDYDVDGVTAAAILWHTLRLAKAQVAVYIPHRVEEGYGLNNEAISRLCQGDFSGCSGVTVQGGGNPSIKPVIVSVDCGITAIEPALAAKQAGVDLVITDHHEFQSSGPGRLPQAHTIVHPRLHGSTYPFGELCGAGVALKLAWQFARVHCGSDRLPPDFRALLLDLISLAALGTVADVVPLVGENRVITTFGLGQIKRTRFTGLNALIDATNLRSQTIDAYHVGFVLGPRLNACGRMGHAGEAFELLINTDPVHSLRVATQLSHVNEQRRSTERKIFQEANELVLASGYDRDDCRVIVLGKEGWHPGVVGIVASRLVEAFSRPVVLMNFQNGEAQGSARSVEGVSIHHAFECCSQHLTSFGGHAMAAGLRLQMARVEAFREAMINHVNTKLNPSDLVGVLTIESECELGELTIDLCDQIQSLMPFGRENPAPVLCAKGVTLSEPPGTIGQHGRHLRLAIRQGDTYAQAVWFGAGKIGPQLPTGTKLDIAFEPRVSLWQSRKKVDLHVRDVCLTA